MEGPGKEGEGATTPNLKRVAKNVQEKKEKLRNVTHSVAEVSGRFISAFRKAGPAWQSESLFFFFFSYGQSFAQLPIAGLTKFLKKATQSFQFISGFAFREYFQGSLRDIYPKTLL